MIEGAFLPVDMLDPDVHGRASWWGTSSQRPWQTSQLGPFVLHTIRERGLVIWGEDVTPRIPKVRTEEIVEELLAGCEDTGQAGPARRRLLRKLAGQVAWI
jgi:hypothetical protein